MDQERVIASAWLPEALGQRFEDYRWKNRLTKTDVIVKAIEEYLDRHDTERQPAPQQAQP